MADELTSVEAERDSALELLRSRTAELVYLFVELKKGSGKCATCSKALDSILEHLSNPNLG